MKETTMLLRDAAAADVRQILKMMRAMRGETSSPPPRASIKSLKFDLCGARRIRGLVVEINRQLVGYALFQDFYDPSLAETGIHLCDIYVHPDHRRSGVASAIMEKIAEIALDSKRSFVWWVAEKSNDVARLFYLSLGARHSVTDTYGWIPFHPLRNESSRDER